jgi:hypothetical protein
MKIITIFMGGKKFDKEALKELNILYHKIYNGKREISK